MSYLFLVTGLALLIKGVDWLLDSAVEFAKQLGIPAFVIGMTLIAMGTSAPEAAIGVLSGLKGANQVTLGDVIGSSIINITLIIGLTAVILPLKVEPLVSKREIPLSLLIQLTVSGMLFTGWLLSRGEAFFLLAALLVFMAYIGIESYRMMEWNRPMDEEEQKVFDFFEEQEQIADVILAVEEEVSPIAVTKAADPVKLTLTFLLGLAAMIGGARLIVDSSIDIAHTLGWSEEFIGLTVVAIGTSLPEMVTCLAAAMRKKADIAVGNIIGSNIFNVLFVLGLSSSINPISASPEILVDLAAMLMATVLLLGPAWYKQNISRLTGLIMIGSYVAYMTYRLASL